MVDRRIIFVTTLLAIAACVDAAPSPFFDAVYDAVVGNGRRTYGYDGYGGYNGYGGQNGYDGYNGYGSNGYYNGPKKYNSHREPKYQKQENRWKEICKVHFPQSWANPGANGMTCPY